MTGTCFNYKNFFCDESAVSIIEMVISSFLLCLVAVIILSSDLNFLFNKEAGKNNYAQVSEFAFLLGQDLKNMILSDTSSLEYNEKGELKILSNSFYKEGRSEKSTDNTHISDNAYVNVKKWIIKGTEIRRFNKIFFLPFKCSIMFFKKGAWTNTWTDPINNPESIKILLSNKTSSKENCSEIKLYF